MSKILKVGVIGVGGIARVHFPGWKDSPYAEVVALADPDPVALNRAAQEQGVPVRYERPADLIADPDLDIVDICTPNMYHMPLVVAALDSGKHVLCEKPLAPTPEAERAIKARVPLRRYGTKEEIGDAAVFLSCEAARYVTGTILDVDGGSQLGDARSRDGSNGLT